MNQYAYQWYLEPHEPSLWPYTDSENQTYETFDYENGTWEGSVINWMKYNGITDYQLETVGNCGIVEDIVSSWQTNWNETRLNDGYPYGYAKRPSGISYLDAFKQFEIYPHPIN